jgi:hypothetical protein
MNKSILFASILSLAAGAAWVGCGSDETGDSDSNDDDGEGGSGGGSTGTGNTGNPTSSSSSSSSSSGSGGSGNEGGGAGDCPADAPATAPSNGACIMLEPGGGGAGGDSGGGIECNPVTNEPCNTGAGEACDTVVDQDSGDVIGFTCYPAPNDGLLCETCDTAAGEYCAGTMTCAGDETGQLCLRYCCDDGDCGSGTCQKGGFAVDPDVGLCL